MLEKEAKVAVFLVVLLGVLWLFDASDNYITGLQAANTEAVDVEITLVKGYNLISLPVTPSDTKTGTIIKGIKDDVSAVYYLVSDTNEYIEYTPAGSYGLSRMEPGKGYIIEAKKGVTLKVTGTPYEFQPITLKEDAGYMIGGEYKDIKLSNVLGTCSLKNIKTLSSLFDGSSEFAVITIDEETVLSSGKGYYIGS